MFNDVEGKTYEIIEKVTQTVFRPLDGPPTTLDGSRAYQTSCGIPVSVKNGVFVTRDDVALTPVD
jgi:hypothetical protein